MACIVENMNKNGVMEYRRCRGNFSEEEPDPTGNNSGSVAHSAAESHASNANRYGADQDLLISP